MDAAFSSLEVWQQFRNIPCELWVKLPNITKWQLGASQAEAPTVLKQMSNLKLLSFHDPSDTWPFAMVPNPEKLTRLNISVRSTRTVGEEMWSRLTNLKYFDYSEETQNAIKLEYLTSLENFDMWTEAALPSVAKNTNLTMLRLEGRNGLQNMESISGLTKLRELSFYIPNEPDNLNFQFLAHLSNLTMLSIAQYDAASDNINDVLLSYIPHNLLDLELQFDCDVDRLAHLTNLQKLSLLDQNSSTECVTRFSHMTYLRINHRREDSNIRSVGKLTKLSTLLLVSRFEGAVEAVKMPNLSQLMHLTRLHWGLYDCPMEKMMQIKYLTNLQFLSIAANARRLAMENCDFLDGLTNLTHLKIFSDVLEKDSLWTLLTQLTNMRDLNLNQVDRDDRLLLLTSFSRLTLLNINTTNGVRGVHSTALTSLQELAFNR